MLVVFSVAPCSGHFDSVMPNFAFLDQMSCVKLEQLPWSESVCMPIVTADRHERDWFRNAVIRVAYLDSGQRTGQR
jgi:hypothetical protein